VNRRPCFLTDFPVATVKRRADIWDFRFDDLRYTFASWCMMNGGDLYELAQFFGHSNIKMTERYAKLAKHHIARTSNTAREVWKLLEPIDQKAAVG
jgi:integrase